MADSLDHAPAQANNLPQFLALTIGAIGVVYGDIGTSPLYAFREALRPFGPGGVGRDEVIGLVSLVLWTLTAIVTIKYVLFLLRADNDGEGGTLSLLALLLKKGTKYPVLMFFAGVLGAALFIGDAMITPALSVLSAVEGLKLVAPALHDYVLPISVVIILLLFAVQSRGTGAVSVFFGPITLVWFLVMAAAGVAHIGDDLAILSAFNPLNAIGFLWNAGLIGFIVLGAIFLTVTGAEALYADLGHFGRHSIQAAWFAVVFPALALNYLGQGALVLSHPDAISNPFFLMFPNWALLPMVILATAATIIASQSVITGAFSLIRQAIHLGFLPRFEICYTSETQTGQIYLPLVNTILLTGVLALMLMFGSSEALAPAYGVSITGAMVIDTILAFEFVRRQWGWPALTAIAVLLPLFSLELVFLGANLLKVHHGGLRAHPHRRHLDHDDVDLAEGCQRAAREDRPSGHPAEPVHGHSRTKVRACSCPSPRNSDLPDRHARHDAGSSVAQHQAQSRPSSAQRHHDHQDRPGPLRAREGPLHNYKAV